MPALNVSIPSMVSTRYSVREADAKIRKIPRIARNHCSDVI
jgi:hypothetical protein